MWRALRLQLNKVLRGPRDLLRPTPLGARLPLFDSDQQEDRNRVRTKKWRVVGDHTKQGKSMATVLINETERDKYRMPVNVGTPTYSPPIERFRLGVHSEHVESVQKQAVAKHHNLHPPHVLDTLKLFPTHAERGMETDGAFYEMTPQNSEVGSKFLNWAGSKVGVDTSFGRLPPAPHPEGEYDILEEGLPHALYREEFENTQFHDLSILDTSTREELLRVDRPVLMPVEPVDAPSHFFTFHGSVSPRDAPDVQRQKSPGYISIVSPEFEPKLDVEVYDKFMITLRTHGRRFYFVVQSDMYDPMELHHVVVDTPDDGAWYTAHIPFVALRPYAQGIPKTHGMMFETTSVETIGFMATGMSNTFQLDVASVVAARSRSEAERNDELYWIELAEREGLSPQEAKRLAREADDKKRLLDL